MRVVGRFSCNSNDKKKQIEHILEGGTDKKPKEAFKPLSLQAVTSALLLGTLFGSQISRFAGAKATLS